MNTHHGSTGRRVVALRTAAMVGAAGLVFAACSSTTHSGQAGGSPVTSAGAGTAGTIPPPPKVSGSVTGPGVTATTITIGQITTTSGPVPGLFQDANDGLDAYVAYLNANGGIAGRQVKVIHMDDGLDCNTYTQDLQRLSTQVFAMVGTFTLEDTCGKQLLKSDPNLIDVQGAVLDPELYTGYPNVFSPAPDPPGYSTTGYQWIKDKFPADITHAATLIPGPAEANGKEQELTAESIGYKYVYSRIIGPFETNFTSDILRMKSLGVKIVDLGVTNVGIGADFIQQAAQQGFHPDAIIGSAIYDAHLFKLLGNPHIADNLVYAPLAYALYLGQDRATVPGVNTFLTWLDQTHPGDAPSIFSIASWGAGMLLTEAMAKAGAGGAQVDQASTILAMSGVTSFNSGGLTATTDPGQRLGAHCMVIAGIQNGQWVRLDPKSGFECNGVYHDVPLSALK
jgi:ABC-type branched-subunit amino acid transport system substrate-binding protein